IVSMPDAVPSRRVPPCLMAPPPPVPPPPPPLLPHAAPTSDRARIPTNDRPLSFCIASSLRRERVRSRPSYLRIRIGLSLPFVRGFVRLAPLGARPPPQLADVAGDLGDRRFQQGLALLRGCQRGPAVPPVPSQRRPPRHALPR